MIFVCNNLKTVRIFFFCFKLQCILDFFALLYLLIPPNMQIPIGENDFYVPRKLLGNFLFESSLKFSFIYFSIHVV